VFTEGRGVNDLPSRVVNIIASCVGFEHIALVVILNISSPSYSCTRFLPFRLLLLVPDTGPVRISDWVGKRTERMDKRTFAIRFKTKGKCIV